jgi:hypothetical protein
MEESALHSQEQQLPKLALASYELALANSPAHRTSFH